MGIGFAVGGWPFDARWHAPSYLIAFSALDELLLKTIGQVFQEQDGPMLEAQRAEHGISHSARNMRMAIEEFDFAPRLSSARIDLRPIVPADREPLYAVAADPLIWEVHPSARWQRPMFDAFFDEALAEGGGLIVHDKAEDGATGAMIGSSRYSKRWCEPGEVEIGWSFLARTYWGGGTNRDLKGTMLAHAFRYVDTVIFRVGIHNIRSRRAMEKIGGIEVRRWFHPTSADVVEHVVFAIKKQGILTDFLEKTPEIFDSVTEDLSIRY